MMRRPPRSTLFPPTTLFRSIGNRNDALSADLVSGEVLVPCARHHAEERFLHGNFNLLSLACVLSSVEGREYSDGQTDSSDLVTNPERFGTRPSAVLPCFVCPTGHCVINRSEEH